MGGISAGRVIPQVAKRSVGPFIFLDYMGPMSVKEAFNVPRHPHIGPATFTYLFKGALLHKDSTGVRQMIHPHEVNFMSAGLKMSFSD